jgi:hypothetical protein
MASIIFNSCKSKLLSGDIDLNSDTIKVALVASTYVPDQDSHDNFDDVTNEITGTGYTAGGTTVTGLSVTADNTNNIGVFDADDISWSNTTITARAAVIYKSSGVASTSPLIAYIDFGSDKSTTEGTFGVTWGASGVLYVA